MTTVGILDGITLFIIDASGLYFEYYFGSLAVWQMRFRPEENFLKYPELCR
jgi:hypothetical protein